MILFFVNRSKEMSSTQKCKFECYFNKKLKAEFSFLKSINYSGFNVFSETCKYKFSIKHGGRNDITVHLSNVKHKGAVINASSSLKMETFFRKEKFGDDEKELVAREGTFAYHAIRHNHTFRSMDCTSKLVNKLYDKKFHCSYKGGKNS